MKIGDLVMDDRSHMEPSNLFYNAFKRLGIVMAYWKDAETAEILWTNHRGQWTTHEHASKLVVISESH